MLARSSLVVLALLSAGCLKDLTQVETGTGGVVTETTTDTTDTTEPSTETATTDDKPACGNGKLEPGEQCDDGNATPDDGCEVDCTKTAGELCGNKVVDDGEECDDGNDVPMDGCENNCTETEIPASCGDGMVNGDDECDDGNDDNTDACTNTCKNAVCGDGVILAGTEECDDGNDVDTDECLSSCKAAICGDGQIQEGVEACDKGGDNSDTAYDGCTTQCQLGPHCGDSEVQAPEEECDDGSPDGDDLCNACKDVPFRYVFVTSLTYKGDVNKLNGGDIKCTSAADNASLPGDNPKWVAWLSDEEQSASARMDDTFVGWYVLPGPEPVLVARDWAGLTSGMLQNPINRDESGAPVAADALVWTNTKTDGKILSLDTASHCNNWDSNAGTGSVGNPNAADATWANNGAVVDCNSMHHLYCVQN
ncbi:Myxococcus cysteine-rich repeat-containing protein [Nannocystis exedens]|uniref:Myxococcus cysteine-rich repeat-containing protein n=1 Tax=Nannocystis exedens TaxID=54 RepID=A0A1I2DM72_9BACT|nr:DUF4215 domain-containing protein [Nannocystis exedens]PCC69086.1 lipoprotein [Nannocystis exedens]SFE81040.1 Myxococcus cysteine-rich repeat-containing protein [Nannocystis exedens]